ncbi:uncharacterized protein [Diadema antillarum]|uniref:uncharacterized protein n=1 Tax=Diadema antillarum TaxID=105358 RepID=UPI003A893ADD
MDGSYIVIDSTTSGSDLSSSLVCLDKDSDHPNPPPHPSKNQPKKEVTGDTTVPTELPTCVNSPIVILDSSSEESCTAPRSDINEQKSEDATCQGEASEARNTKTSESESRNTTKMTLRSRAHVKESTEKCKDGKNDVSAPSPEKKTGNQLKLSLKRPACATMTPIQACRKRQKVNEPPSMCSTPISGSANAPDMPTVTPIAVRYDRIRCELSATKKQQQKLLSVQEELQEELAKFRQEFSKKKEEETTSSVLVDVKTKEDGILRPVVIDGSNVAMSHGNHKVFSCKGIALCVQFFQKRGHKNITVLVPLHRKTSEAARSCPIKDRHILDDLESKGLLSFTPSRELRGRRVTPYDDRFIIQLACDNGGVIVSNDNYRDLMGESPQFKRVIENRLLMYVFARDNFMVPEDPHGRYGPRLDDVLRRNSAWSQMTSPKGPTEPLPAHRSRCLQSWPLTHLRRSPRLARLFGNSRVWQGGEPRNRPVSSNDRFPHPPHFRDSAWSEMTSPKGPTEPFPGQRSSCLQPWPLTHLRRSPRLASLFGNSRVWQGDRPAYNPNPPALRY